MIIKVHVFVHELLVLVVVEVIDVLEVCCECIRVCEYYVVFFICDDFVGVEVEIVHIIQGVHRAVFVLCSVGLCAVFDNF